ncbi:MAG: protein phosphatase 2C domain-containing protein, partial [Intestinibacter sp.]
MLNGISAFTIGQSHIDEGIECQDSNELDLKIENYVMAAVADGHGSKKHFRSAKGSRFATDAAKDSIYEYMKDYDRFVGAYEADKDYLIDRIIKMIITKWHQRISEDLDENPITQEEIDKYLKGDFNEEKVSSVYGTTLLVGVMSEKCNFGFLIGDGSFVVIDKHGKAFIPIED